ncbi:TrmH family RNA methyltransferase [Paenibacillus shirakamiensis]|uniref:TrmH family RNA methyltransferase n=1 Tax=Paenibacillus shirakamiensis TaxID=1265935 RepID=A0ABS4JJZ1_9BACL|nr:RNA methyltransferase [Paenibacillus shirakamiensis]MBP2002028.1 TrmH family RNA methyltransferase [Paenibacillus shirakamiensis]
MEIMSPQNARVKQWAQLLEKKHRDQQQRYLIEGVHLVKEALENGADVECIAFLMERAIPSELASLTSASLAIEWIGVSEAVIAKCSDTKTPQPVFAVVRKHPSTLLAQLLKHKNSLVIVLDGVQDPGNVGTIIRTADAAGAHGVIVGRGSADVYSPKTLRSTMGSVFHIPIVEGDLSEILPMAQDQGIRLAGTSLQSASLCYEYDFSESVWLVFGNEAQGLSGTVEALLDDALIIPMKGKSESLNVAMAASVLLYEALRQREYRR